jgi:thioredoxin 2
MLHYIGRSVKLSWPMRVGHPTGQIRCRNPKPFFFESPMPATEYTLSLVCPDCLSVNRVPEARLADGPVCGKCKQSLTPGQPIELTDANFKKFLSRTDLPIVVDFWAAWCGPCQSMAPAFTAAAEQLSPNILLAKLSTEESQRSAAGFNITGIPCLIAFRGGKEVARQSGAMNAQQIVQWTRSVLP